MKYMAWRDFIDSRAHIANRSHPSATQRVNTRSVIFYNKACAALNGLSAICT